MSDQGDRLPAPLWGWAVCCSVTCVAFRACISRKFCVTDYAIAVSLFKSGLTWLSTASAEEESLESAAPVRHNRFVHFLVQV